ncbi:DUF4190 domain-containing protein [Micromonospora sp. LOL_021]|uniref:DUF4190 domain-containing protein n=1 Tax=Micromonospora sp. LOL_021 TaxID=3345417 RepID=UPI003A88569D
MKELSVQPGYPGQDPYGQQPQQPQDPTSSPPSDPYGQQPPSSGQPYSDPYGQQPPSSGQPYSDPYGQQPPGQPYPQQPMQPYGDPYAQQPVPGQPYPAGGYGMPGQQKNNHLGLIGMIVGITSLVLAVCCPLLGIPAGIAGAVLGFLGKNKVDQGLADNRGQAMAGLICGAIGVVLGIANSILGVLLDFGSGFNSI